MDAGRLLEVPVPVRDRWGWGRACDSEGICGALLTACTVGVLVLCERRLRFAGRLAAESDEGVAASTLTLGTVPRQLASFREAADDAGSLGLAELVVGSLCGGVSLVAVDEVEVGLGGRVDGVLVVGGLDGWLDTAGLRCAVDGVASTDALCPPLELLFLPRPRVPPLPLWIRPLKAEPGRPQSSLEGGFVPDGLGAADITMV